MLSSTRFATEPRRIQKHRVSIGENAYTGVSKTTAAQLDLFEALALKTP